ncbi:antirestriction protein ArdA [Tsukamurella sp. USMM236]|uniref:antirestriction protein ArdA n=1 Tax=Tsukamurella sp. USMM236 TaxID=3081301 RepID=UPI003019838F
MTFTDDELWIERMIARRVLAPGARGMTRAQAADQHNQANALAPGDDGYLTPAEVVTGTPITVVDRQVSTAPAVWIGCLQCYNAGRLIGDWFKAADAAGVTTSALHGRPIPAETHEELWVMDHEGIPVRGEMSPATATEWAEVLELVPEWQRQAFDAWLLDRDWITDPETSLVKEFEDAYAGEWSSFRDYADEYLASTGLLDHVPDEVKGYFDLTAYARDLEQGYNVIDGPEFTVFVFHEA